MSDYGLIGFDMSMPPQPESFTYHYRPMRNIFKRPNAWRYLDWTVEAGGYRLVIEGGAMTGLEYLGDPFTCDNCGGTFNKAWSDEEATAEAEGLFPAEDLEEGMGVVCDDCFHVIMAWAREEMPGHLIGAVSDDPIGDALRADAEAAREEIRSAGIVCPSCDVNMADLPDGHALEIAREEPWTARCGAGKPVLLAVEVPMGGEAFRVWQNASNVALYDDFRRREAETLERIVGDGPANFTGLLGALGDTP